MSFLDSFNTSLTNPGAPSGLGAGGFAGFGSPQPIGEQPPVQLGAQQIGAQIQQPGAAPLGGGQTGLYGKAFDGLGGPNEAEMNPIGDLVGDAHLATGSIAYKDVTVLSLNFMETARYKQLYTRPFVSNLSPQAIRNLENGVDQLNHGALQPHTLGQLTSGFITVSAAPETPVQIANGWDTKRFSFDLTVQARSEVGSIHLFKIQGYTDHPGMSNMNGVAHEDPNMVLFINDITKLTSVQTGTGNTVKINSAHNTLYDIGFERAGAIGEKRMMRPQDMSGVLAAGIYSTTTSTKSIYNTANIVQATPQLSARTNSMPGSYLSRLLDSYLKASDGLGDELGCNESTIHGNALRFNRESMATSNPFLERLNAYSQDGHVSGRFRMRDLARLDPDIKVKTHWFMDDKTKPRTIQYGDEVGWEDGGIEMNYASSIVQALPSMMIRCKAGTYSSVISNVGDGRPPVARHAAGMFHGSDAEAMSINRHISNSLISLVLCGLSYNYEQRFEIAIQCNLYADTRISVSVNGGQIRDYVFPTFTDSLTSPVITTSNKVIEDMSNAVQIVAQSVSNVLSTKGLPAYTDFQPHSNTNFGL